MHRLMTARSVYHSNVHSLSVPSINSLKTSYTPEIQCSFCRKFLLSQQNFENLFLTRHQSTRTANAIRSLKKKTKYKAHKKYGELLEVNEKHMTETKVSINNLRAEHLSKLASSSLSLGQLHQLTTTSKYNKIKEVDPELLQSVKNKLLKKSDPDKSKQIKVEDDKCALVFTNVKISNLENMIKTKEFMDMVKESYYNFRKATIYDQRLQDLRYAINEGLDQEFHFNRSSNNNLNESIPKHKGPHAVFRELFVDNHLDSYDQELMAHLCNLQSRGLAHPALEDVYDEDSLLNTEYVAETKDDGEIEHIDIATQVKALNVKKAKQALRKKKKERREKRRTAQEQHMKQDSKEIERRSKQDALNKLLNAHLQLLCSLNMMHEGQKVLQYYRQKKAKGNDHFRVTDVKVYNTLLHGYAAKGKLESVREILSFMTEDKMEPNAQTFAAVFEAVERSRINDKVAVLQFYENLMQEKNIKLNDLLDKSKFLYDQREVVMSAVRKLQPDYEPHYTPPILDYNCPLLEKLKLSEVENREGLNHSPATGVMTLEEMKEKGRQQFENEINGEVEVQNINVQDENSKTVQFYRQKLTETENEWRQVIKEAFVRNLGTLKSQSMSSHSPISLYPYLKVLGVDQFVELILTEISRLVDGSETFSPTLKSLQKELGTKVLHRYQIEQYRSNGVLSKKQEIYDKYCEWYVDRSTDGHGPLNPRQAWQTLVHLSRHGASLDADQIYWPAEIRQNIGKFLYNIITNDVKFDVNIFKPKAKQKKLPAVYRVHRSWGRLVRLELKPHPALARLWASAARATLRMRAALLPAPCPPAPWSAPAVGAALLTPTPLVRISYDMTNHWKRIEETPPENLYPVLDSLNQLGEVPWVVNKPILDLQLQIFRSGGNKKLDIPPPASSLNTAQFPGTGTEGASGAYKRRVAINRARADMHSLWCDALYKLSLANHFRDTVFWLAHNIDFRGRAYACPPHLSQLGADAARALLQFARARPLGAHGLRWLKLHAVNLTGTHKRQTVDERLQYAESIMDLILDSADHPLDGRGWWQESEEPWQTLACCIEIANAMRSPNPEEYMCGFPVHQDGSCNGLQHYAALGGDAPGARAVNLAPASRPQDVYSAVAALVEEMRLRDAAAGVPVARVLEGFVRRKVIKQTVMTTVYGVTRFGARLQIAKQLKDIEDFPKEMVWASSQYLTARTFDSLREMFSSTKLIQDWFTDCAKVISGVCGSSVEWVTPLGLPVLQPYTRRNSTHHRPCTMKQRNAFPPNFIHSLDSSHMMLTALRCQARAVAFVSVHDCFWTHPDTVHQMNQICREEFVALHSQPILEDLSAYFMKTYSYPESEIVDNTVGAANKKRVNYLLQKVPNKGDFDIRNVLKSVYFFS